MTLFKHTTAAKGLLLSCMLTTAVLILLSPQSLTGRAADPGGDMNLVLATGALLICALGFADILWTDLTGRLILPSISQYIRHKLCTLMYAVASGWYSILAFTATDVRVDTSWILVGYYIAMSWWGAVLTISIAVENRGGE